MGRSLAMLISVAGAWALAMLAAGCGLPCHGLTDCPAGQVCSLNGSCVEQPPPPEQQPVTCDPAEGSSSLMLDTGFTEGATLWDCPTLRAVGGSPTVSLDGFGTAVNGGSLTLQATLSGGGDLSGRWLYFGIGGDHMFAKQLTADTPPSFPVDLFFSTTASWRAGAFYLAVDDGTGSPDLPRPTSLGRFQVNLILVQSGDIQASVAWDNDNDVDLHVTAPDGTHIYYANSSPRADSFGQLDLDSSVGCATGDPRNENIFFPTGTAIDGEYRIAVDLFQGCDPLTHYRATVVKGGAIAAVVDGSLTEGDPASRDHEVARITWP